MSVNYEERNISNYEIIEKNNIIKEKNEVYNKNIEKSLISNKFDPFTNSPNLFLTKLEFRINNYLLEEELFKDTFKLDSK